MTIREAVNQKIRCVRQREWEPTAHIELPLLPAGGYGPWAIVRDVSGERFVPTIMLLADSSPYYEPVESSSPASETP